MLISSSLIQVCHAGDSGVHDSRVSSHLLSACQSLSLGRFNLSMHHIGNRFSLFDELLDQFLIVLEDLLDDRVVDCSAAIELRNEQVAVECSLDPAPVGNEIEDEAEEGLEDVHEAEDHPVGEPDAIIIFSM